MKLKDYSKAELEAMSYDDIAYIILSESNNKMKINTLFKKVCDLLGLSDNVFTDKIGDFFEILSTDQRFIMLTDGSWDLKTKHGSAKIVIDDEEDDMLADDVEDEEDEYENEEDEEKDLYYDTDETDDQDDDDLKDLVIIDEDEEGNELN
ncbi:MAG: DNA-directed RNA polymerase subunit delta [Bacilli bacterium]